MMDINDIIKQYGMKLTGNRYIYDVNRVERVCPVCGNEFTAFYDTRIYCSPICSSKARTQRANITQKEWSELRELIIERDNFTCQECGFFSMTTGLAVHHKQQLIHGGDNKPENLVTLCNSCHGKKHHA